MKLSQSFISLLCVAALVGCDPDDLVTGPEDGEVEFDLGALEDAEVEAEDAAAADGCEDSDDCSADNPICAMDGQCVECLDNTYCPALSPICSEERTCTDMGEGICREDFDCEDVDIPICLRLMGGLIGVCVECTSEDDCIQSRPYCSTAGRCVPDESDIACMSDSECGPPRLCQDGECIERAME